MKWKARCILTNFYWLSVTQGYMPVKPMTSSNFKCLAYRIMLSIIKHVFYTKNYSVGKENSKRYERGYYIWTQVGVLDNALHLMIAK